MDQLFERQNMTKLTQKETDNLKRHIVIEEIKSIINNFSKQKARGPDGFTMNSTKHLWKKW